MDFPAYIDSSIRTTWNACKRKHFWSTLSMLYPMGISVHLHAGGAVAAGLEAARKRVFLDPNPLSVSHEQMLLAAYLPFLRHWGDYEPPENSSKSFVHTFAALEHYLLQYPPATDSLQPYIRPDGSPAVEYKFAIPLDIAHPVTGEPILFSGRFDMIGELETPTGKIVCVVDEKTTGSLGFDWASKWDLRGQFLGYIWALRQHGINVRHACINGLAILKTKDECRRALVMYPDYLIDRWAVQMHKDVRDMVNSWHHYQADPSNLDYVYPYNFADSCESYGGCAFATLCAAKDPEPFLSNYIKYRFNPLDVNPVKEQENA